MALPIRTLPIVERWDCHNCGICCRGSIVQLSQQDVDRLRSQRWEERDEFRGVQTIVADGLLSQSYRLAQRDDGSCVFLTADGLCRVHMEFGEPEKPLMCRMFPLQLVPLKDHAILTTRRCCPSAADGKGRPIDEHRRWVTALARQRDIATESPQPPHIVPGHPRAWNEIERLFHVVERLVCDDRFPMVRRLVHVLAICDLLEQCQLSNVADADLGELLDLLSLSATENAGECFANRRRPGRAAGALFRQTVLDYLRLHPQYVVHETWRERWKLAWAATRFARGKGSIPKVHDSFPATTFADIDEASGWLSADLLQPLDEYYESLSMSRQYAMVGRLGWSVVERLRAAALTWPVAMWLLRYARADHALSREDTFAAITAIDRGQGYAALSGRKHRRRVACLSQLGALDELLAWYTQ